MAKGRPKAVANSLRYLPKIDNGTLYGIPFYYLQTGIILFAVLGYCILWWGAASTIFHSTLRDDFMLGPTYGYTNKYMLTDGMFYTPLNYFLFSYCTKG